MNAEPGNGFRGVVRPRPFAGAGEAEWTRAEENIDGRAREWEELGSRGWSGCDE